MCIVISRGKKTLKFLVYKSIREIFIRCQPELYNIQQTTQKKNENTMKFYRQVTIFAHYIRYGSFIMYHENFYLLVALNSPKC